MWITIWKDVYKRQGIVLILLFAVYAYLNIKKAGSEGEESENGEDGKKEGGPIWKHLLVLVVCAVLLYFGANLLVDNGILIAEALGVPERVIAVTFIALGTSLPELVTSLVSIIKGYGNVGLGNIVGANIPVSYTHLDVYKRQICNR